MQKRKVRPAPPLDELVREWVRDHGEAMSVKEAAELVGVCPQTIYRRVWDGSLRITPEKRVLTRSLAVYANSFPTPTPRRKKAEGGGR